MFKKRKTCLIDKIICLGDQGDQGIQKIHKFSQTPHKKPRKLAKTVRTAEKLLKVEAALWTFVYVRGAEPTNYAAEQALRTAVIWRRTSFGSQSQAGSEFVSRILTVVTSLKAQQRNPLDYLTEAIRAKGLGLSAPSLLPQTQMDTETPMVA